MLIDHIYLKLVLEGQLKSVVTLFFIFVNVTFWFEAPNETSLNSFLSPKNILNKQFQGPQHS